MKNMNWYKLMLENIQDAVLVYSRKYGGLADSEKQLGDIVMKINRVIGSIEDDIEKENQ